MAVKAVNEYTRRQAEGLRQLRERLGLKATTIAGRLGYDSSQAYELYERAKSRLPLDQVPRWAEAFGVSEAEFLQALGFSVVPPAAAPWSPRAALEAAGLDRERIAQVEQTVADWDEVDQRVVVEQAIREHREAGAASERHRSAS